MIEKTQCLPLYRYTEDGERVSNITKWGIEHINGHYRREWGEEFQALAGNAEQRFPFGAALAAPRTQILILVIEVMFP